jgi:hypothetical protein
MDSLPENLTEAMMESDQTRREDKVEEPKTDQKTERPRKMRFMLSGLADDERKNFFDFLSKHNVDFVDENTCDPKVNPILS